MVNDKFMTKPFLLFAYGNLSRGDDALGPLLLAHLETQNAPFLHNVDFLTDFQLQIEHALDLENRALVLFVDASMSAQQGFSFQEIFPEKDQSYTTHAMSPAAVLSVYQQIKQHAPPPCFLLSIHGAAFELGTALTTSAEQHLTQAIEFTKILLRSPDQTEWRMHEKNQRCLQ
jgi:hydrogenase maturation protease